MPRASCNNFSPIYNEVSKNGSPPLFQGIKQLTRYKQGRICLNQSQEQNYNKRSCMGWK